MTVTTTDKSDDREQASLCGCLLFLYKMLSNVTTRKCKKVFIIDANCGIILREENIALYSAMHRKG